MSAAATMLPPAAGSTEVLSATRAQARGIIRDYGKRIRAAEKAWQTGEADALLVERNAKLRAVRP